FFPLLTALSLNESREIKKILLATYYVALGLLATAFVRLAMGSQLRGLANSGSSLFLLLTALSILIFHLNSNTIINRTVDITVFGACIAVVCVSMHRSVLLAGATALFLIFGLYRRRLVFLSKMIAALVVFIVMMAIIMINISAFEQF